MKATGILSCNPKEDRNVSELWKHMVFFLLELAVLFDLLPFGINTV